MPFNWQHWLRGKLFGRPVTVVRQPRPRLTELEGRWVPAVYNVTTTADVVNASDGMLSLREAVLAANATSGVADTINVPAGTYTLTLTGANEDAAATGDLDLTDSVSIVGLGAASTIIDGNLTDRVFDIRSNSVSASLSGMTVRNGFAATSVFEQGGGIRSLGNLSINQSVITGNTARGGASPAPNDQFAGTGNGGGIYTNGGTLAVSNSTISGNLALGWDNSLSRANSTTSGGAAYGGGIAISYGTLMISNSRITGNRAIGGQATNAAGNAGGGFADGGAISIEYGSLGTVIELADSLIADNQAIGGAATALNIAGGGNAAGGGLSLDTLHGTSRVDRSAIVGNSAIGGSASAARAGGGNALGGGLEHFSTDPLVVTDSTVSGNYANGGNATSPTASASGGTAKGGGLTSYAGTITNCTIAFNGAVGGGGNGSSGTASGGGFWQGSNSSTSFRSTIIAKNTSSGTSPDVFSTNLDPPSLGSNLIGNGSGALGFGNGIRGDQVGTAAAPIDPLLGPLAFNGGPTPTHALLSGSPAIDRGSNAAGLTSDQRGFARTVGGGTDVGAFEAQPMTVQSVQINDGNPQRSEVRSLTITFSGPVSFANNNPTAAFTLSRIDGGAVGLVAGTPTLDDSGRTVVTLTFAGAAEIDPDTVKNGGTPGLADGKFALRIVDGSVIGPDGLALDGDNNGVSGGAYVSPSDTSNGGPGQLRLFRLFGDATGDGMVDAFDLQVLRTTINSAAPSADFLPFFDANNDANVDALDLNALRSRINTNLFTASRIAAAQNLLVQGPFGTIDPANISLWSPLTTLPAAKGVATDLQLTRLTAFALDYNGVARLLETAPQETDMTAKDSSVILAVPTPDGSLAHFRIVIANMMEPGLAAQYPDIRTIRGQGIEDPAAVLSADITSLGFHAQVLSPNGAYYVDPYYHLDFSVYAAYRQDDEVAPAGWQDFDPGTDEAAIAEQAADTTPGIVAARAGTNLRIYRVAVAGDGEYTAFFGNTVANGQAAIVTAVNRVSGIMETELAIRLVLVANNSSLVYTSTTTDPYSNTSPSMLLTQNQSNIDSVIGSANYDIGHVFTTGGGGLAQLGVVGKAGSKARGETGLPQPVGDAYYVDYVIHEMGHEFGANHTFNTANDTSNRHAATAYEPGSGSTIMAYAGIEGSEDLQPHSDPYYHSASFDEIIAYVNSIPSIGTLTPDGNTEPTVNGGLDYTIPTGTPFALTASGSDADGDALTYGWEERDLGAAVLLTAADNGSSPIFRSFNPTTSPTRTFPQLSAILNGSNASVGEKLPAVARTAMNFRVTVRDNRAGGGGVNTDDVKLTVVNTGSPFLITSQNTGMTWTGGTTQTVTWSGSAGTSAAPINATTVNILLSTDGGNTFPITLASGIANNGSATITVPNDLASTTARIKVVPTNNIFFDINNANITIVAPPVKVQSVVINDGSAQRSEVQSLTVTFSGPVTFANNPTAAFALTQVGGTAVGVVAGTPTPDAQNRTVVTLTFTGVDGIDATSVMNGGAASLADGRYQLTILANQVMGPAGVVIDGNGDGTAGGDYTSPDDTSPAMAGQLGMYRLFGDSTGDAVVDAFDLLALRNTINRPIGDPFYLPYFDANNDGFVDSLDLNELRTRINTSLFGA
jgi:hypothetical protein